MTDNVNRYARLIRRGNVVVVRNDPSSPEREAVVREVDIVLHLADGADVIVPADDQIELVVSNFPDDFEEQVESTRREAHDIIPPPEAP